MVFQKKPMASKNNNENKSNSRLPRSVLNVVFKIKQIGLISCVVPTCKVCVTTVLYDPL